MMHSHSQISQWRVRLKRDVRGNEPLQTVLLIAIAALILLGVRAIGHFWTLGASESAARVFRKDDSSPSGELVKIPPPDWTRSEGKPGSSGDSVANPRDPDDQRNLRLGEILPELSGNTANWKLGDVALAMAVLSEDAYRSATADPPGWKLLNRVLGQQGFAASVYLQVADDGRQRIVVAFRGTEGLTNLDAVTDAWNVLFGSEQYLEAIRLVRSVQRRHPGVEILLTGHSLGGGLAAYSAAMTGLPAIPLNAAGPSYPHLLSVGLADLIRRIQGNAFDQNIVHVNARRDPLTNSDAGLPWSENVFTIKHPNDLNSLGELDSLSDLFGPHGIAHLIESLKSDQPILRRRR